MISDSRCAKIRSITERLNDKELNNLMIEMGREMERMDHEIRTLKSLTKTRDSIADNDTQELHTIKIYYMNNVCEILKVTEYAIGTQDVFVTLAKSGKKIAIPTYTANEITIE